MSPDTVSPRFPADRPIAPLPKRRLRERLSPEVVNSIKYPPVPESNQSLFYYSYDSRNGEVGISSSSQPPAGTSERNRVFRRSGVTTVPESDDDEGHRTIAISWPSSGVSPRLARKSDNTNPASSNPAASAASSVDGYDSLENTNNKKKRKIPSAGDHLNSGSTLAEISNLSISHQSSNMDGVGDGAPPASGHYGSTNPGFMSSAHGISGPGRGRFGRTRNGRSPLRALSDSNNNWTSRGGKLRPLHWAQPQGEGSGIISSAIANAEKHAAAQGQENTSLLQQTGNAKSSPVSSLFTFTCESQVGGSATWPSSDTASSSIQSPSSKSSIAHNMQSTQTSPPRGGSSFDKDPNIASSGAHDVPPPRRKPKSKAARRQRLDRELLHQAEERRREAQMRPRDSSHPDDEYICLYCEYETLFGEVPWALIRQYELKDRRRRRDEAERKRLIEKAKSRSRKNRKAAGKSASKASSTSQSHSHHVNGTQTSPHAHIDHPDDVTDDYDEEDVEEDGYPLEGHDEVFEDEQHDHVHNHGHAQRPVGSAGGGGVGGGGGVINSRTGLNTCTCAHG